MLFSDLKFYVPPDLDDGAKLRNILSVNGGSITDALVDDENVLYILDSFGRDNALFSKLCDKGRAIISSKCIYDSIKDNKPLPEIKYPLYARFMEGITVCKCSEVEDEVGMFVRYMGGTLTDTTDETTHYLIAKKVGSIQYLLAQQHHVPIILPDWINSCWAKQCLLPHKEYILPPFAGCVISVTGLTASTRNEIQRLAKAYGGEYTPNLTKRCTHLLSKVPQGIKYRYALEWGIHCVSIHWFFDSINLQVCADETRYFLPMSEATRQALFNPLSTSPRDLNRLSPALRKKHLMQLHRKRRSPATTHPHHPYDLYIISAFSRVSSSGNHGRTLIRSLRSDVSNPSGTAPPYMINSEASSEVKNEKEEEDDEDNNDFTYNKTKPEDIDELETDSDTNMDLLNNPAIVPELYKLVSLCSQAINYYTDLARKQDISSHIDTLLNSNMVPSFLPDHQQTTTNTTTTMSTTENNVIADK
jgi:hypothetical protein